jgi:signal peptidase I
MSPTFEDGEWVLAQRRRSLGSDWCPRRFDKVLVRDQSEEENLSKRVIGLPGDTVELKGGIIYLNGEKLQDPFGNGKITFYLVDDNDVNLKYWSGPNIGEDVVKFADEQLMTVQKGFVWVIGDNRVISWFGLLPIKDIRGRILY